MGSGFGKGIEKASSSILGGGMGDSLSKGAMKMGGNSFGDSLRSGLTGLNQVNTLMGSADGQQTDPNQRLQQLMQMLAQQQGRRF